MDVHSRLQCGVFGDVLAFDTTYNTNKYSMVFAPFSGVDNHFNTVFLGGGFIKDETIDSFLWLFETWVEASGRAPNTIITDQDPAMRAAIEQVFPFARHRFCIWHITKKLTEKLGGIENKIEVIEKITKCIWDSETDSEFCVIWASIITEHRLHDNDWLASMFEIKHHWIPLYLKSCFFAGMHSSQRSESLNSFIKRYSTERNTLMDFYARFTNGLEEQRQDALEDEHQTIITYPKLKTTWSLEKQMSQIYTKKIFYKFQDEVVSSLMHNVFVGDEDESGMCRLLEFLGIPCRHLIAMLKYLNHTTLPIEYIVHRWTRSVTVRLKKLDDGCVGRTKRSELSYVANQLIEEALDRNETFTFAMITLRDALEEIQRMKAKKGENEDRVEETTIEDERISQLSSNVKLCIKEPDIARPKGSGKRLKSPLEKQSAKARLCTSCKQRGVNHDKRNCFNVFVVGSRRERPTARLRPGHFRRRGEESFPRRRQAGKTYRVSIVVGKQGGSTARLGYAISVSEEKRVSAAGAGRTNRPGSRHDFRRQRNHLAGSARRQFIILDGRLDLVPSLRGREPRFSRPLFVDRFSSAVSLTAFRRPLFFNSFVDRISSAVSSTAFRRPLFFSSFVDRFSSAVSSTAFRRPHFINGFADRFSSTENCNGFRSEDSAGIKPEKFNGNDFRRWQAQVEYWLNTLGLLSAIFDAPSSETEIPSAANAVASSLPSSSSSSANTTRTYIRRVPYRDPVDVEYHCRNRILSALSDSLYDVFLQYHTAKDLWYALEARYNLDNAGIERYNVSNLHKFKIDASKPINPQIHQLDEMLSKIRADGSILSENYLVACLIDALPDSWSGFSTRLRHDQSNLTYVQIQNAIRIEEEHKSKNSKTPKDLAPKVNLTESQGNHSSHHHFKAKRKNHKKPFRQGSRHQKPNQSKSSSSNQNLGKGKWCFICGRTNHLSTNCFYKKTEPMVGKSHGSKAQANMIQAPNQPIFGLDYSPSLHLTCSLDWWLDSGANVHTCFDRSCFSTFQDISGGSVILGDASSAKILGRGRVDLRLTFRKTLALHDVLFVPRVRKNLISGSLSVKKGYKIVLESNKVVITLNDLFIDYSLVYPGFPEVLEGYSDVNWVTDSLDVKSTTGFVFLLGGVVISWASTKQTVISKSTMKSELIALDTTCAEAEWIKNLLSEIPLLAKPIPVISLHCDNKSVIDLTASNSTNSKMNKFMRISDFVDRFSSTAFRRPLFFSSFVDRFSSAFSSTAFLQRFRRPLFFSSFVDRISSTAFLQRFRRPLFVDRFLK
ncbi:Protein FAR1-RELATED SEQUENCE 5 [Platanthera zijinensis]|uniref:Protein FAR1-RELATED SEQUENCE 5 n=1 Tax=Platanthera zijinensis TaxID=2320716 RepID=A0AAP0ATM2_9ASPA